MMAARKKKPEDKNTDTLGSTRSIGADAEKKNTRSKKSSSDLKGQTPEKLIHELQVHQIELETQAEELIKAKLALEESREKYLDLYDFAPVGYLTLTDKELITEVNLTGASLLGVERSKLVKARFKKFVTPQDYFGWNRYFASVLKNEKKLDTTLVLIKGDGSTFTARLESIRLTGSSDSPTKVRVAISDITDIWQLETLRESEERFRTILHAMQFGIVIIDAQTHTILDANHQALEMIGGSNDDVIGKVCHHFICPAEPGRCPVTDLGQICDSCESFLFNLRGKKRFILKSVIKTSMAGKDVLIESFVDITERKRTELELVFAKDSLKEAHHLAHIGTWDWIMETDTVTWSEELYNIAGRDPSLPAPTYAEHPRVYAPASWDRLSGAVTRALTAGEPYNLELELVRPDGSIRWVNAFGGVKCDGEGKVIGLHGTVQDITERKLAEESLQLSERRFRGITERISDLIIMLDPEGYPTFVSPSVTSILGFPQESYIGKRAGSDIILADDVAKISQAMERLKNGSPEEAAEFRMLKSGGSYAIFDGRGTPIITDGIFAGVQVVARDITERKRAEDALRESEDRYRALAESSIDDIFIIGRDDTIRFVNSHAAGNLHLPTDEIIGKPRKNFFSLDIADTQGKDLQAVFETGDSFRKEAKILYGNQEFWLDTSLVPLKDETGNITAVLGVSRDITEHKQVEEALRESEIKYRSLAENSLDFIITTDFEGVITYANPVARNLVGERGLVGVALKDYMDPDQVPRHMELLNARRQGFSGMLSFEWHIKSPKEGSSLLLDVRSSLLMDKGSPSGILFNARNITERKKAEETIRHALAEKEVLLREVHHRVKNNLAGILSLIELQISSLSDPVQIAQFNELETRIRSMALVHESLCSAKDLTHINVASYTKNLTHHLFKVYGTGADVQCKIEMEDIPLPIETVIPCGLVMNEIITNSLKYAFPKTFSCEEIRNELCTISLTLQRDGSDTLLGLADNGIGMPEGIDVTISHSLGLFLIQFIVEHQLGGSIEISTARGTAYTIRFPAPAVKEGNAYGKM